MKKIFAFFIVILFLSALLSYAGQSASKVAKMGDKAVTKGDYYSAAISYLDVLVKKPTSTKTIQRLAEIAKQAYDQKLKLAKEYQDSNNLEGALREFKELEQLVGNLRKYNAVNFVTIDFNNTFSVVSEGAAESRYKNAEGFFVGQNYDRAIEEYRAALNLKSPYKDSVEKISESYYRIGAANESSGAYRKAAEIYLKSCETVPNYKDATKKAVAIYYALGNYFFDAGHFRSAALDYSHAQTIDPNYLELPKKIAQANEHAKIRVAFVRFDNTTGNNIAGIAIGDVILENLKSAFQAGASQFVDTFDRDELQAIALEQRISAGQLTYDMAQPTKLAGVDYLIFGKLNQVRELRTGPKVERMNGQYEYRYFVPYTNKNGKQDTRTEYATGNMTFDLFTDGYKINLAGAIKAIEAKSGTILINEPFLEEGGDEIIYADNFRAQHDLNSDLVELDKETVDLIKGRRVLQDSGEVANRLLSSIANRAANALIATLDKVSVIPDPTNLKY
jgi:tetratricopeptide (TPR) repeat protein